MPTHPYDPMYGRCWKCQRWLPGYPGGYHGETISQDEPRCECYLAPRAPVMPEHMASVDPIPEDIREKEKG